MIQPQTLEMITSSFDEFTAFVQQNLEAWTFRPAPDRWTFAQHAEHLWISGRGVTSVFRQSDDFFAQFPSTGMASRDYDQLEAFYRQRLGTGLKAPTKFSPAAELEKSSEAFFEDWAALRAKILKRVSDNWTEEKLDQKTLLHPAIKVITVRELIVFNQIHVRHHIETLTKDYLTGK